MLRRRVVQVETAPSRDESTTRIRMSSGPRIVPPQACRMGGPRRRSRLALDEACFEKMRGRTLPTVRRTTWLHGQRPR
jgi:hypothetical protein